MAKLLLTLLNWLESWIHSYGIAIILLTVVVRDMQHYEKFLLGNLTRLDGVTGVHSSFVLRHLVKKTALPLD